MGMRIFLCFLLFLGTATVRADLLLTHAGTATPGGPFVGPLDVYNTSSLGCWSIRACSAAIALAATHKLFQLKRASDSVACDFIVTMSGGVGNSANCSDSGASNGQSATSFCNATTCATVKWYDQVASADVAPTGAAVGPQMLFTGCSKTGLFCLKWITQAALVGNVGSGDQAQPVTMSVVYNNTFTDSNDLIFSTFNGTTGTEVAAQPSANVVTLYAGSFSSNVTASDGNWHAVQGVINSSSSILNVDGSDSSALNPGTNVAHQPIGIGNSPAQGSTLLNGFMAEVVYYGSAMGATPRANMHSNQSAYFGTP